MSILAETFGQSGTASQFFGGQWWAVGILLIVILVLYFYARGLSAEGVALFLFAAVLFILIDELFVMPQEYVMLIIVLILMFFGFMLWRFIGK